MFKAPYVVQHTARFQSEQQTAQQRTLTRQSESVARRNKLLDGSDISRGPEVRARVPACRPLPTTTHTK